MRAGLEAFWPGGAAIFSEIDSPISLAFLERYPSPKDARRLGEKRLLEGFLSRNDYSGRKEPAELLERLTNAPTGTARELETEARREVVLSLVATLRPLVERIKLLSSRIAAAVGAHPDGEVFLSVFRSPGSTLTAARLVA